MITIHYQEHPGDRDKTVTVPFGQGMRTYRALIGLGYEITGMETPD